MKCHVKCLLHVTCAALCEKVPYVLSHCHTGQKRRMKRIFFWGGGSWCHTKLKIRWKWVLRYIIHQNIRIQFSAPFWYPWRNFGSLAHRLKGFSEENLKIPSHPSDHYVCPINAAFIKFCSFWYFDSFYYVSGLYIVSNIILYISCHVCHINFPAKMLQV